MTSPAFESRPHEHSPKGDGAAARRPADKGRLSLSEWNRRIEVLERTAVLFTLPAASLRSLARRLRPLEATAGKVLISQGEIVDSLLIIADGRASLKVAAEDGRQVTVASLGPGELFGESGCVGHEPSPATLVAVEDTRLYSLDRQSVDYLLAGEREVLAGLQRLGDQRTRTFPALVAAADRYGKPGNGDVIAVYAAKGGSGRTTIALNLAASLARQHPGQVLLVDLALPFNHAALLANLLPSGSLARSASAPEGQLEESLLAAVAYHASGMLVLSGTLRAEEADLLRPEHLHAAMDVLRPAFRYVILDLGVTLDDVTLAALEHTRRLVLVATPELTTLHGASELIEIMGVAIGIPPESITVVLNQRAPRAPVSKTAVEEALGRPVDVEIRHDGARTEEAALRGVLSLDDPKSEIGQGVRTLAGLIEGAHPRAAQVGAS